MKAFLLKTETGIALEIDGVVSECTLDYSEEVAKWIADKWGIVDVDKISENIYREYPHDAKNGQALCIYNKDINCFRKRKAFIKGFEYAQSLNSEKQFTRDDMEKSIENYAAICVLGGCFSMDNLVSYLRPNRVECTVEMEENQCDGCKANMMLIGRIHQAPYPTGNISCQKEKYNRPKIVNNTIKVLTIKN